MTARGLPVCLRALSFIVIAPGMLGGWLPWLIAGGPTPASLTTLRGAAGASVIAVGWAALLWCAREFAIRGRGTPAPYDAPRALVTTGLYRFTRNPMYVGVVTAVVGWSLLLASPAVGFYAVGLALAFHLRVRLYEEPVLTRMFGSEFEAYQRRVPRWVGRRQSR